MDAPISSLTTRLRRREHGIEDLAVARAAANVPAHRHLRLLQRGLRALIQQFGPGHDHPGYAEPALHCPALDERPLQRVQVDSVISSAALFPGELFAMISN